MFHRRVSRLPLAPPLSGAPAGDLAERVVRLRGEMGIRLQLCLPHLGRGRCAEWLCRVLQTAESQSHRRDGKGLQAAASISIGNGQ